MSEKIEEKPLHEVVLDILYFEDVEKPVGLSPEDIFLIIKDAEISERKIREVLEWLVLQKRVVRQFGKYYLDKYEFIERANQIKQVGPESKKKESQEKAAGAPRYISIVKGPPPKRNTWRTKVALLFFIFSLIALLFHAKSVYEVEKIVLAHPQLEAIPSLEIRNLYLPTGRKEDVSESEHVDKKLDEIAYLFHLQTEVNKKLVEQVDSLFSHAKVLERHTIAIQEQLRKEQKFYQKQLKYSLLPFVLLLFGVFFIKKL